MVHVLTALIQELRASPLMRSSTPKVNWDPYPMNDPVAEAELTQDYLWPVSLCVVKEYFRNLGVLV